MLVRLTLLHAEWGDVGYGSSGHLKLRMPFSASGNTSKIVPLEVLSDGDPKSQQQRVTEFVFTEMRRMPLLHVGLFEGSVDGSAGVARRETLVGFAEHPIDFDFSSSGIVSGEGSLRFCATENVQLLSERSSDPIGSDGTKAPSAVVMLHCEALCRRPPAGLSDSDVAFSVGSEEEADAIRRAFVALIASEIENHDWVSDVADAVARIRRMLRVQNRHECLIAIVILLSMWWGQWLPLVPPTLAALFIVRRRANQAPRSRNPRTRLEALSNALGMLRSISDASLSFKLLMREVKDWISWCVAFWWLAALVYPDMASTVASSLLFCWIAAAAVLMFVTPEAPSLLTPQGLLFAFRKQRKDDDWRSPEALASPTVFPGNLRHDNTAVCFFAITAVRAKLEPRAIKCTDGTFSLRGPSSAWQSDVPPPRVAASPIGVLEFFQTFCFDSIPYEEDAQLTFEVCLHESDANGRDVSRVVASTSISAAFAVQQLADRIQVPLDSGADSTLVVGELEVYSVRFHDLASHSPKVRSLLNRASASIEMRKEDPATPFSGVLEIVSIQFAGSFMSSVGYGAHSLHFSCGKELTFKSPATDLRKAKESWCDLFFPLEGEVLPPWELRVELHDVRCRDAVALGHVIVSSPSQVRLFVPLEAVEAIGVVVGELVCVLASSKELD